ncbi:hypothetical protein VAA_02158 [Vibrio anguillarum 775]|nr:hypothetical protein VAA_02158 [Vibrio anguillarum 775]
MTRARFSLKMCAFFKVVQPSALLVARRYEVHHEQS